MLASKIGMTLESRLAMATAPSKAFPCLMACHNPVNTVVARGMSTEAAADLGLRAKRLYGSNIVVPISVSLFGGLPGVFGSVGYDHQEL